MKYIIEDDEFTYSVDFAKKTKVEGGFVEEYFPSAKESIEAFLILLKNEYTPQAISEALAEGLEWE